jgi:hypothetical protein
LASIHPAPAITVAALRRISNGVLSGGLYRGPRTSSSRNKAVCKDAVCSFVYVVPAASNCHATFADTASVISELEADGCLSGGDSFLGGNGVALQAEPIVGIRRLAASSCGGSCAAHIALDDTLNSPLVRYKFGQSEESISSCQSRPS